MRTVKIENDKLKQLLEKKTESVIQGREITLDIEAIELDMAQIDKEIQELEKKVDLKEFEQQAEETTAQMNTLVLEMDVIQKKIYAKMKESVPPELGVQYEEKKKAKEELENQRNKIGLKIQKWKDLIIPLTQREAKNLLQDEFEDFGDVRVENGEVVVDIFSHLEDWKAARNKKLDIKK